MPIKSPHALKDISKLLSGNLFAKVIGLAVLMVYVRVLTKEQMAVIPVYLMLSGLATLPLNFGILPTFIKRLPSLFKENLPEARSLVFTGSLVIVTGTLLVSIIIAFFAEEIAGLVLKDHTQGEIIRIMSIGFVALSIHNLADRVLWAMGRFGRITLLRVVDAVVRPSFTITLFYVDGLRGLVLGLVLAQMATAALSLFYIRDIFSRGIPVLSPVSQLGRGTLPLYLESYLIYFRNQGDNWVVSTMLGPSILGVYYVAKVIFGIFFMIYIAVDKVITERLSRLRNDRKVLELKTIDAYILLSQSIIPLTFLTISLVPLLLYVIGGEQYVAATEPAIVLLLVAMVTILRIPIDRTVFVVTRSSYRFYTTFVETLILLPSLFVLAPFLGSVGVAGARLLGQVAGGGFGLSILKKQLNITLCFKESALALLTSLPVTLVVLAIQRPPDDPVHAVMLSVCYLAIWIVLFCALSYLFNRPLLDKAKIISMTVITGCLVGSREG